MYFLNIGRMKLFFDQLNFKSLLFVLDGVWGAWGAWSSCSGTCGNATIVRTRVCPNNGLPPCSGSNVETQVCSSDCVLSDCSSTFNIFFCLFICFRTN